MKKEYIQFGYSFLLALLFSHLAFAEDLKTPQPLNLTLSRQQLKEILNPPLQTQTDLKKILFVKVTHNSVLTDLWAKKMCARVTQVFSEVYGAQTESHCFKSDTENPTYLEQFNSKITELKPDYLFEVQRGLEGELRTKLSNLNQSDKQYANSVGWKIQDTDDFDAILKDRLIDSSFSMTHLEVLRDSLAELVLESHQLNSETFKFDPQGPFHFLRNSHYWTNESRKFILAGTQLLATLGVGWYGYHYLSKNNADYDYTDFKESIKNKIRLGSEFRYDDNSFKTNEGHVFAGVTYYLECRGAGLTALQSYMCSMAGSAAWEVLVEWREVFSINDQIFTSTGGAILGESIHQLGNYIDQKAPPWFKHSIGWLWKAPKKAQQFLNSGIYNGTDSDLDAHDPLVSGKFEFVFGTVQSNNGRSEKRVGFRNEVNLIPFYAEPGHEVKIMKDLVETELNFDAPTQDIVREYDIFAKVVLAAYYAKNINIDSKNNLNGYSFFVGPSAALELKNETSFNNDFMGVVHVIGSTAQLVNFYKGFKITSSLDLWGDSVMVKSFMIEKYKDQNGASGLVGNLASANYYHGFGYTSRGQVVVEFGPWSTGLSLSSSNSTNTNGRQRDLGQQLKQLDLNDQLSSAEVFIERTITANFKIRFAVEKVKRAGEILGFGSRAESEVRKKFSIVYYF